MSKQQPINDRGNSEEEFASKSYNGGFIMCTHDTAQTLPPEPRDDCLPSASSGGWRIILSLIGGTTSSIS